MESCVLCMDTENKTNCSIRVNSIQWDTENIKHIIEKHLWPVDTSNESAGVCTNCWHELKKFHKFYERLENTRLQLDAINKTKYFKELIQNESANREETKNCKKEYVESNVEAEILMEQPEATASIIECENPLIKMEHEESFLDDIPYKQRRKRGRPPKDMIFKESSKDPLKKTNQSKSPAKSKKLKHNCKLSLEPLIVSNNEDSEMKPGTSGETFNDAHDNTDSDSDYEDHEYTKTHKKKRKNPDEKTRQEHDELIAEYFKIFCSLCQIPIENFIALRKHFREEHNKRGFVICCKKKIFTRPILVDHINFHLDPNYFKCKHCEKIYSDRCTLESHIKIHEDGQQDRNHTCDACGKSFVGTTQLENHKLTHAPNYEKQFSCGECGKLFTTLYSLNYHIQAIHHNKYVKICDICGKTMRCRNSFKLHMEKHDNKLATPIHCDICGLRLVDRRGLRRHKNSQHPVGGKKEYSCHLCLKVSPNQRALRTHVRFAHETGYIHKCTMCDKAFKRPEALKEHMATHTGTPLYTCPWCPKTFISNGNMHNHRKKSHPREWEEAQRQKYGGIFPSNYKPPIAAIENINKTS